MKGINTASLSLIAVMITGILGIQFVPAEEDIPAWQKAQESTDTPKFNCLLYSDGKLAVINSECDTSYSEISWFLSKGYHIDAAVIDADYYVHELYMSR